MSIALITSKQRHTGPTSAVASRESKPVDYRANPKHETCSSLATLAGALSGQTLRISQICGQNGHTQRLRELGMYEGQTVKVLLEGNPLICQIGNGRFGICHRLARHIIVELPTTTVVAKQSA